MFIRSIYVTYSELFQNSSGHKTAAITLLTLIGVSLYNYISGNAELFQRTGSLYVIHGILFYVSRIDDACIEADIAGRIWREKQKSLSEKAGKIVNIRGDDPVVERYMLKQSVVIWLTRFATLTAVIGTLIWGYGDLIV